MQLTIREMTRQATSPKFWIGLLGVVCVLTVSAPFSTDDQFNFVQRFFYWGGIVVSTYFCATLILPLTLRALREAGKSEMVARVVASLAAGIIVSVVVFFINTVVVGIEEFHWKSFLFLSINCSLITLAVSAIFFFVNDALNKGKAPEATLVISPARSPFYERLPQSLGTNVISLQAQDHYVDVRTTQGNDLILIRLSDAIKELGEEHGVQTHRSWWVTNKHMVGQKRIDGKPHLVLSDGNSVPVSRTYSADVKAAIEKQKTVGHAKPS